MAVAGHDADQVETMKPVPERVIKVTFNADRHASMQWNFKPQQTEVFVSIASYLCSCSGFSSKQNFNCSCLLRRWFLVRRHWHSTERRTPQTNPSPASPPTMWFPLKLDSTSTRSRWIASPAHVPLHTVVFHDNFLCILSVVFLLWRAAIESPRGGRYARLLLHWPRIWRRPKDGAGWHHHTFLHFLWGQGGSEASSTRVQLDWIKQGRVPVRIQIKRLAKVAISLMWVQHE